MKNKSVKDTFDLYKYIWLLIDIMPYFFWKKCSNIRINRVFIHDHRARKKWQQFSNAGWKELETPNSIMNELSFRNKRRNKVILGQKKTERIFLQQICTWRILQIANRKRIETLGRKKQWNWFLLNMDKYNKTIISLLILLDYDCAKLSFDMVLYGYRESTTDIYVKNLGRINKCKWK